MDDNERVIDALQKLQGYGALLTRQDEYAEAVAQSLNAILQNLASLRALPDLNFLGDVILVEPYEEEDVDSRRAYVAMLHTTLGLGAVAFDSQDLRYIDVPGEFSVTELKARMRKFDDLPLRVRARLASQVVVLTNQLLVCLGLRPRPLFHWEQPPDYSI